MCTVVLDMYVRACMKSPIKSFMPFLDLSGPRPGGGGVSGVLCPPPPPAVISKIAPARAEFPFPPPPLPPQG